MSDILLEVYSEEIPGYMQKIAADQMIHITHDLLRKAKLKFQEDQIKVLYTPNRLSLYFSNFGSKQRIPAEEKIGPQIDADIKAIEGFMKSVEVSRKSDLKIIKNKNKDCYSFTKPAIEIDSSKIMAQIMPQILRKMVTIWPKSMRWNIGSDYARWARPIRNIAAMQGSNIIEFEFAGLSSNNKTFGHITNYGQAITIPNVLHYEHLLKENNVILDQNLRMQKILTQIRTITHDLDLKTIDHESESRLYDEVNGLCEMPTALIGEINQDLMDLPEELLVITLKNNQKYFCLRKKSGNLSEKFIFITNAIINGKNKQKIIKDNEKLVRARLSDAKFFIQEDLKVPLIDNLESLKKVVFHQKLGSIYDKTIRLKDLSRFLSFFIPHCELYLIDRACNLSKADLVTKAVFEYPELQGKIGSFYSSKQGEDLKVVVAVYEHYMPIAHNADLPKTPLGIALSIADKIDSIVGFFLAGERPTGSRDPFALRRAALGIIRIGFEHNLAFPIRILIEKTLRSYPGKLLKQAIKANDGYDNKKSLIEDIIYFFVERLKAYLKENDRLNPEIVNAVVDHYLSDLNAHRYCDILYIANKIRFLDKISTEPNYRDILELYKRASGIIEAAEKQDNCSYDGRPSRLLLKNNYQKDLFLAIKKISGKYDRAIKRSEFDEGFEMLATLKKPMKTFFDKVMINDKDSKIRENNLLLLSQITNLFNKIYGFSKIEIF